MSVLLILDGGIIKGKLEKNFFIFVPRAKMVQNRAL
tara:strand:- start:585 stop:692 length:108 start_codon:yes stop_codon:yes gene_type:complete